MKQVSACVYIVVHVAYFVASQSPCRFNTHSIMLDHFIMCSGRFFSIDLLSYVIVIPRYKYDIAIITRVQGEAEY